MIRRIAQLPLRVVKRALAALDDVESVFGVNDFITVSKTASADWATLMPKVVEAIQSTA